jgi:hypothetical protein
MLRGCTGSRRALSSASAAPTQRRSKQLLEVERGWHDMKQVIDLRPVYHRKEERIRTHVILCWLALLLARTAENACGATWPELRRELGKIQVGIFTSPRAPSGSALSQPSPAGHPQPARHRHGLAPVARIPAGTYASAAFRGSCVAGQSADDYRASKPYVVKKLSTCGTPRQPRGSAPPVRPGHQHQMMLLLVGAICGTPSGAGCEGSNPCGGTLKVKRRPAPSGDPADAPPTSRVTSALVGRPAHGLDGVARRLPGRVVQAPARRWSRCVRRAVCGSLRSPQTR